MTPRCLYLSDRSCQTKNGGLDFYLGKGTICILERLLPRDPGSRQRYFQPHFPVRSQTKALQKNPTVSLSFFEMQRERVNVPSSPQAPTEPPLFGDHQSQEDRSRYFLKSLSPSSSFRPSSSLAMAPSLKSPPTSGNGSRSTEIEYLSPTPRNHILHHRKSPVLDTLNKGCQVFESPCSRRRYFSPTSSFTSKKLLLSPVTPECKFKQNSMSLSSLAVTPAMLFSPRKAAKAQIPPAPLLFTSPGSVGKHHQKKLSPRKSPTSGGSLPSLKSHKSSSNRILKEAWWIALLALLSFCVISLQLLWELKGEGSQAATALPRRNSTIKPLIQWHNNGRATSIKSRNSSLRGYFGTKGVENVEGHEMKMGPHISENSTKSNIDFNDGFKMVGEISFGNETAVAPANLDGVSEDVAVKPKIVVLWGIITHHGSKEAERQQALRDSYLSFGVNARGHKEMFSFDSPPRTCKLSELATRLDCDMAYVFIMGRHPKDTAFNDTSYTGDALNQSMAGDLYNTDDALYLDVPDSHKNKDQIQKTMAWIKFASKLADAEAKRGTNAIIGAADMTTLVYTPHLMRHIYSQGTASDGSIGSIKDTYIMSPTIGLLGPGRANFWYVLSRDIASKISNDASCEQENLFTEHSPKTPGLAVKLLVESCFRSSSGDTLDPIRALWQANMVPATTPARIQWEWENLLRVGRADDQISAKLPEDRYTSKLAEVVRRHGLVRIPPPSKPWWTFQAYFNDNTKRVETDRSYGTITNSTVSYVSGKFSRTKEFVSEVLQMKKIVEDSGLFDDSQLHFYTEFPEFVLHDARWARHIEFLKDKKSPSARGGGYWFWKAPLIHHHLEALNDGDWLVYADVDLEDHILALPTLIAEMDDRHANLALYEQPFEEREWTKMDTYHRYCPDKAQEDDRSHQYAGGFLILRKTDATVQFIQKWENGVSDYHLISDEPSVLPELPHYKEHRHDQSILNALIKCTYKEPRKKSYLIDAIQSVFTVQTFRL